jgi:aspartate 4-decarboxylase
MLRPVQGAGTDLAKLSPFELKDELIKLARAVSEKHAATIQFLNAGRGNPNWTATTPREAFFLLGQFALAETKRDWDEPGLGGMPRREGSAARLREFLTQIGAGAPGARLLSASIDYGTQQLGFDADAWVYELTDALIGDNYPVPGRMLVHCEQVVHAFLEKEMFDGRPPPGKFDIFAVEGGTAAMCYLFNSLATNRLLKPGDTIALGTPIFTPYIEMTHLAGFKVVNVEQGGMKDGMHSWRYTEAELKKLENPKVKAFFLCNPSNPASVAVDAESLQRIARLVRTKRPDLIVLTDDVYGTFVDHFRSLAAEIPQNTILVYSYSKHFGCTGWRLGVIAIHENNIFDRKLAKLPKTQQRELAHRYGSLTLEPLKMKFIDRMVADSRFVALNHTAGLSLPNQVQMALFSLFSLLDSGDAYKKRCQAIVQQRLQKLLDGLKVQLPRDEYRAAYYAVLDLEAWARRTHGDEFMEWATQNHLPLDIVFGLARNFGTVLLNGDGFGGPPWSARVSLANLPTDSYEAIGKGVATAAARAEERFAEWKKQRKPPAKGASGNSRGKGKKR